MRLRATSRLFSRFGLGLGVLLGSAGLVLANTLSRFAASYRGTAIRVEWEVSTETDLTAFSLGRKLPNEADFTPIGMLAPTGQLHYTYTDTCLVQGREGPLPGPVVYRLTLRGSGPDHAYTTVADGSAGPLQRSWGTVKVMFR